MSNKKRYQKIFVNGECIVDFTEANAESWDVFKGKTSFNSKGEPIVGTIPVSIYYDSVYGGYTININLVDESLDMPGFLTDYFGYQYSYARYNIDINKNSYIGNNDCYSCGANYGYVNFNCQEPMTYSDVWNCLEDPSSADDSYCHITGITEVTGQIEETDELMLPSWTWIPEYSIQIYAGNFNKVILPAEVESVASIGYSAYILKCLGTTPPEASMSTIDCASYIEVPEGCKETYKSAENWCEFADRIYEVGEELPEQN